MYTPVVCEIVLRQPEQTNTELPKYLAEILFWVLFICLKIHLFWLELQQFPEMHVSH